jgi:transposase InsO family protein
MANDALVEQIREVHRRSRQTYGVFRIYFALRKLGRQCSRHRVARLMRQHGIYAQRKSSYKVTTQSNHSFPVAVNKLNRQFQVSRPNVVWSSDITYIATAEGWLYLAVVMDLYSRQIIGWSMQLTLQRQLVLDALKMALQRRQPGQSLLHHSDRGSQYASHDYQSLLARYGIEPSMSRRGNCYDNSPVESFFASLKKECVRARVYKSRYQAKSALFDYIEVFYNRQRLHSSLGYHSPIEFERLASVS